MLPWERRRRPQGQNPGQGDPIGSTDPPLRDEDVGRDPSVNVCWPFVGMGLATALCLRSDTIRPISHIEGEADIAEEGEQCAEEATQGNLEVRDEADDTAAVNPKVARKPVVPTKAMIQAHEVHHADYKERGGHGVHGKGVSH